MSFSKGLLFFVCQSLLFGVGFSASCNYWHIGGIADGACTSVDSSTQNISETRSFKCDGTIGSLNYYSNDDCSGTPYESTKLTDNDTYSCSESSDCDWFKWTTKYYDDPSCDGSVTTTIVLYVVHAIHCGKHADGYYFTQTCNADGLVNSFYTNDECTTSHTDLSGTTSEHGKCTKSVINLFERTMGDESTGDDGDKTEL